MQLACGLALFLNDHATYRRLGGNSGHSHWVPVALLQAGLQPHQNWFVLFHLRAELVALHLDWPSDWLRPRRWFLQLWSQGYLARRMPLSLLSWKLLLLCRNLNVERAGDPSVDSSINPSIQAMVLKLQVHIQSRLGWVFGFVDGVRRGTIWWLSDLLSAHEHLDQAFVQVGNHLLTRLVSVIELSVVAWISLFLGLQVALA